MLYDPKWERPDRVYDKVSLRRLIAWLETMPTDGRYDFCHPARCALGQYLAAQGFTGRDIIVDVENESWIELVAQGGGLPDDWTFGAALARARAVLAAG
jgi:hypothetical protein